MKELNNLKTKVQELMLEQYKSIEHIEEWSTKHEAEVQENDAPLGELQKRIKELKEIKNKEKKPKEIRLKNSIFNENMMKKNDLKP